MQLPPLLTATTLTHATNIRQQQFKTDKNTGKNKENFKDDFKDDSFQSYDKYLKRLKTFELFKWFSKPAEFSPIECARHGWSNVAKDTLKCDVCSTLFYYYSPPFSSLFSSSSSSSTSSSSSSPRNVKRRISRINNNNNNNNNKEKEYSSSSSSFLVDKHNSNCPWRTLVVSQHLVQLDFFDDHEEKWFQEYSTRHTSYNNCQNNLPALSYATLDTFESFSSLSSLSLSPSSSRPILSNTSIKSKTISILSSSGWSYNKSLGVLECDRCLRTVGLWLYKTVVDETTGDEDAKRIDPHNKQQKQKLKLLRDDYDDQQQKKEQKEQEEKYQNNNDEKQIVKSILVKCVDSIAIEEETELRNVYFIDRLALNTSIENFQSTHEHGEGEGEINKKKRKLNDLLLLEEEATNTKTTGAAASAKKKEETAKTKTVKKLFDPIKEHFSWCPWLTMNVNCDVQENEADDTRSSRTIRACEISFDFIREKHLLLQKQQQLQQQQSKESTKRAQTPGKSPKPLSKQSLLDKVKSAQAILIDSTSHFM